MRKVIGAAFLSLDGVIQAPGGPTEDPTGGFRLGGWLPQFFDEEAGDRIGRLFTEPYDLLLGRRTYEIFSAYWPFAEGENKPMGEAFDRAGKYVFTTGDQPLIWQNSHRLKSLDDLAAAKRADGPDMIIQGSSTLYPSLLAAGLIDRLILMTFPVILGPGKRLFGEGTQPSAMKLVEHQVTKGGNIFAVYEQDGDVRPASFDAADNPSPAELDRRARIKAGTW